MNLQSIQQSRTYLIISKFTVLQIVVLERPNAGVRVVEGVLANTIWKAVLWNQSEKVKDEEIILLSFEKLRSHETAKTLTATPGPSLGQSGSLVKWPSPVYSTKK